MKDELGGKVMIEFATLGPKTYMYLIYESDENKKAKETKTVCLKFEDYKHCLAGTHLKSKIIYLEKNKFNVDSLRKNHKEFTKNNKLILKSQQTFKREKHNVLTIFTGFNRNICIWNKWRNNTQKRRN